MGRKRILSELEKLDQTLNLPDGKNKVFFGDIVMALGADTENLVKQAAAVRAKLMLKIVAKAEASHG